MHTLTNWCHNISNTKELMVDFRRRTSEHPHISIDGTPVERVSSSGGNITEDLTWTIRSRSVVRKAHQRLFFLRRLKKFGLSSKILRQLYCGVHPDWLHHRLGRELHRKALQRIVQTTQHIAGGELPSLQDIYTQRRVRKAQKIIRDSELFSLLPSGRRYRSIRTRTSRTRDGFFSQAIRLLNLR